MRLPLLFALLPAALHAEFGEERRLKIPHANAALRSLNLSTAAGIACYEALRQVGLPLPCASAASTLRRNHHLPASPCAQFWAC